MCMHTYIGGVLLYMYAHTHAFIIHGVCIFMMGPLKQYIHVCACMLTSHTWTSVGTCGHLFMVSLIYGFRTLTYGVFNTYLWGLLTRISVM